MPVSASIPRRHATPLAMGTVVCLPAAENMGRICGAAAADCFPSSSVFQNRAAGKHKECAPRLARGGETADASSRQPHVTMGSVPAAGVLDYSSQGAADVMTTASSSSSDPAGGGACALLVTSRPSRDGGGTVFTTEVVAAPPILVTAVTTASTATANSLFLQQRHIRDAGRRRRRPSTMGDEKPTDTRASISRRNTTNICQVASPPDRRVTKDDSSIVRTTPTSPTTPGRNGQLAKQGSLTIVRRSSTKKSQQNNGGSVVPCPSSSSLADDDTLDAVDLATDNLPAVDTPDACDKAAIRLRCLLRQLQRGEISAELLQKNLHYAARVLEAVFIDETKERGEEPGVADADLKHDSAPSSSPSARDDGGGGAANTLLVQKRRLRTPVWARRLADEDDELSEVQPDAVPPEVREWLASTFTRQLATTRRKADEKPKFRSVAHAIRAGIFVDRIYRRVSNTALMQFPPEVVKVLKTLDDWSFDVFALSESATSQPVKYLGYDLLNRYGMIHKFKVPPVTLETFLNKVEEGYCRHRNPYHNNLHAADVAQTVHYMLCQTGLMNWLTDLEIFATLVAAIIHDYEHTGTTNNFHVMSGTDTALLYNDRAVLENHHISASFRVMREEECNILQNLSREEFREFRTLVIDMVLATDMSFHFQQLKNMRNLLSLAEPSVDKSKALSLVLHCCDISHPAKRWDLHHRWTMQLLEEFFIQGDKERELGLPFSPLCDRNNTLVAESQIGFIEFIVEPSMGVCSDMLESILGPIHSSCKPQIGEGARESISEEGELDRTKNGATSSPERPGRFKIKKPWVGCLVENKTTWKDQAVKDAELRAQIQQQENEETDLTAPTEE